MITESQYETIKEKLTAKYTADMAALERVYAWGVTWSEDDEEVVATTPTPAVTTATTVHKATPTNRNSGNSGTSSNGHTRNIRGTVLEVIQQVIPKLPNRFSATQLYNLCPANIENGAIRKSLVSNANRLGIKQIRNGGPGVVALWEKTNTRVVADA